MIRFANGALHALHLFVIACCLLAWAFPGTRGLHLLVCGATLVSWFVVGPLIGKPGYCVLTGLQHWMWAKLGRRERPNYMAYLFQKLSGRSPGVRCKRIINGTTQGVLYLSTLLAIYLI